MRQTAIEIAAKGGNKEIRAWVTDAKAPLALHKELLSNAGFSRDYTITHRATGCSIAGLMRNTIVDRGNFHTMGAVVELLQTVGAPLWAELDKLEPGTTRAPKDVIAAHRDTYDAMRQALSDMSRRALRL